MIRGRCRGGERGIMALKARLESGGVPGPLVRVG